ncbi:MAG TPA: tetratricopeptide repeat protein [Kofleriaceae bacterium]
MACHPTPPVGPAPPLPRAAYAHYLDGKVAGYRGDSAGAAAALAAAAAAAPDEPMIAVELARAQIRAKQVAAATDTLARARQKWPDRAEVWLLSAELLAGTDAPAAMRAYERAIRLAPDDDHAYLGLAKLQAAAAAERTLRALVAHAPASVEGHYRLAVRLAERRDLPGAIAELRVTLERDPDHIDARLDLARALRRQGQLADAIAQTRSAFDRSGQAIDIAEELFWLLAEADDMQAALDLLTLLDDDRSDVESLAVVARLDRGLGRLDAARAVAARIAVRDPDAGAIARAQAAIADGDTDGGLRELATIGADRPRAVEAAHVAADAKLAIGDAAGALELAAPVRAAHPEDLGAAMIVAFAFADLHQLPEARAALASFQGAAAQFGRARLADRAGDHAGAIAMCDELIRTEPDDAAALNFAGYLLVDARQRLPDAERYLRHARELAPGDPEVLDSWGWYLVARGDAAGGVRALEHASRYAPREPEILVHLAIGEAAVGTREARARAARALDAAAKLHPTPAVAAKLAAARAALPK